LPSDETHKTFRFIIESDLFYFVASTVSADDTTPTCTYWWKAPELERSIPFHISSKSKRPRRPKGNKCVNPNLQLELPLFDPDSSSPNQNEGNSPQASASDFSPDVFLPGETTDSSDDMAKVTLHVSLSEQDDPVAPAAYGGNTGIDVNTKEGLLKIPGDVLMQPPPAKRDSYDQWNDALITYFTADVPRGTRVFLSIDEDGIAAIKHQLEAEYAAPVQDFYEAVRERVVINGKVSIRLIRGRNSAGQPRGVVFLAVMVIAALQMADEEEYSHANYFVRLRGVLGLPDGPGRPPGLDTGTEESLWKEWTSWLSEKGYLSSARRGKGNYNKFTNYSLSQALLRRTDKNRLCKLFDEMKWNRDWDAETLGVYVRREADNLSMHLQKILHDPPRYQAIINDMYELYEGWRKGDYDCQISGRTVQQQQRHLSAAIYRTEDISGITYFLYPRSPRRQQFDDIQVAISDQIVTFRKERQGWYMPQHPLSAAEVEQGASFQIVHPSSLETLTLPQKPFWILIPDPENPDSGVYAAWGRPQPGTYFIILCRHELVPQLEHLRNEHLIEWSGSPQPCPMLTNWVEIHQCSVISPVWEGVEIADQDLYEKLCPRNSLNITLSGGLRVPGKGGWLEEHGPQITIFGSQSEVDVIIKWTGNDVPFYEHTQRTNEPFTVPWPRAGDYLIEIPKFESEHPVTIKKWEELDLSIPDSLEKIQVGNWSLCGAFIEEEMKRDRDDSMV
jgi:hypothetical protein